MSLLKGRSTYRPFLYPESYEFWLKQQKAHWLHTEVNLSSDVVDWKQHLTDSERQLIGSVLKGFTQVEVIVGDYWTQHVSKWFPHPEVVMAANTMGAFESVHLAAYSLLDQTLGFEDYEAYLSEPTVKAKLDALMSVNDIRKPSKADIARSLAVFSAFAEGVSLFSSFAILLNFSRFNKLKGVGQIVGWSCKDEALHSEFGCYLFRTFVKENPEIMTDEFKKTIYDAARAAVALEDSFIDYAFSGGAVEGLTPYDMKQFIRQRANTKLGDLGFKQNWKNIDKDALERMSWFDYITAGVRHTDFFVQRPTDYQKFDASDMF